MHPIHPALPPTSGFCAFLGWFTTALMICCSAWRGRQRAAAAGLSARGRQGRSAWAGGVVAGNPPHGKPAASKAAGGCKHATWQSEQADSNLVGPHLPKLVLSHDAQQRVLVQPLPLPCLLSLLRLLRLLLLLRAVIAERPLRLCCSRRCRHGVSGAAGRGRRAQRVERVASAHCARWCGAGQRRRGLHGAGLGMECKLVTMLGIACKHFQHHFCTAVTSLK